jgi:hypothetical protein
MRNIVEEPINVEPLMNGWAHPPKHPDAKAAMGCGATNQHIALLYERYVGISRLANKLTGLPSSLHDRQLANF